MCGFAEAINKYVFFVAHISVLDLFGVKVYNKMRENPDIRFKLKKIEKSSDKVFILIQVWSTVCQHFAGLHYYRLYLVVCR